MACWGWSSRVRNQSVGPTILRALARHDHAPAHEALDARLSLLGFGRRGERGHELLVNTRCLFIGL